MTARARGVRGDRRGVAGLCRRGSWSPLSRSTRPRGLGGRAGGGRRRWRL